MDGLLIIDKPRGLTSHDVVLEIRRLLGLARVGHGGTLDPEATGVLLVALGQAVRFFPYLSGHDKVNDGSIRLGYATDTYDASGRPTSEDKASALPSGDEVRAAMKNLEGEILQVPPPYSAKKIAGRPAYELARARQEVRLEPVRVRILAFTLRGYAPPFVAFEARCSSGTYVRSLAHDLGKALGCGAHLHELRRTVSGPYTVGMAVGLEAVRRAAAAGRAGELVLPLEELLPETAKVVLVPEAVGRARNGSALFPEHVAGPLRDALLSSQGSLFRVFEPSGRLLGLARPSPARDALKPFLVLR
ncbi:MAG TPA: tRNA pseudouridine(55) synthase TruB [Burkholderiales bacterium]|nr:tRNA pseudouridine(55) synthase TruB [Burkholderiales bacterium]